MTSLPVELLLCVESFPEQRSVILLWTYKIWERFFKNKEIIPISKKVYVFFETPCRRYLISFMLSNNFPLPGKHHSSIPIYPPPLHPSHHFCKKIWQHTIKITIVCLSTGTPKIINFPFVPNGKFIIIRCPKIKWHYSLMCLNIGTPKNHQFSILDQWKVNGFGCPNTFALKSMY